MAPAEILFELKSRIVDAALLRRLPAPLAIDSIGTAAVDRRRGWDRLALIQPTPGARLAWGSRRMTVESS
jgi:hypothetical protein